MRPIMMDFPLPIVTPSLLLRKPIMGYVDAHEYVLATMESIDELRPWLAWARYPIDANQAEEYIRECCANWILKTNNNIGLPLWIIERKSNIFVGHIVMWNILWEVPKFEFGFWLRTSYTHKGYITEAVNALTRYCFLQLKAKRVEINCETNNIRSKYVAKRLGFNFDGVFKNSVLAVANGNVTDVMHFSCVSLDDLPGLKVTWGKHLDSNKNMDYK